MSSNRYRVHPYTQGTTPRVLVMGPNGQHVDISGDGEIASQLERKAFQASRRLPKDQIVIGPGEFKPDGDSPQMAELAREFEEEFARSALRLRYGHEEE